jgi:hypothetical protein
MCFLEKIGFTVRNSMTPIKHEIIWTHGALPQDCTRIYSCSLVIMDKFSRWLEIALIWGDKKDGGLNLEESGGLPQDTEHSVD